MPQKFTPQGRMLWPNPGIHQQGTTSFACITAGPHLRGLNGDESRFFAVDQSCVFGLECFLTGRRLLAFGITHGQCRDWQQLTNPGFLLECLELVGIQDQSHRIANPKRIQYLDVFETVACKPIR